MIDQLQRYLRQGLSIIPLKANDKRPQGRWKQWQKTRLTPQEVDVWWSTFRPAPNVGVVTGSISGDLVVLDIEPEYVEFVRSRYAWDSDHPTVVTARGGLHLYCRGDQRCGKLYVDGQLVGDVRGEGGYVVAPPSTIGANPYRWQRQLRRLPGVPDWAHTTCSVRSASALAAVSNIDAPYHLDPPAITQLLSSSVRRCLSGWTPYGSFPSPSELDFAVVFELVCLGLSLVSAQSFIAATPALKRNFTKHFERGDDQYLNRMYVESFDRYAYECSHAVDLRCVRSIVAPGGFAHGAQKRALIDFVDVNVGERYPYTLPVVLGPPNVGEVAGEWRQLGRAYGVDQPQESLPLDGRTTVKAIVSGSTRTVRRVLTWDPFRATIKGSTNGEEVQVGA